MKQQHAAIYVSSKVDKKCLIRQLLKGELHHNFIGLTNLKFEVFSQQTKEQFIDEELRHDHFKINLTNKRNLITFSDGEQRKALLAHLISKQPDCLILDTIFDNLDLASQHQLADSLSQLSSSTIIIQLANRKADILSFIEQVYLFENNKIVWEEDQKQAKNESHFFAFSNTVPLPLHAMAMEQNPLVKFNYVSVCHDERRILNNIQWEINAGEFWQLIGPNGSGKSTLLSMVTGDNAKAYNQDLILFGRKKGTGETVWEIKAKIGYLNSSMTHLFSRRDSVEQMVVSGFYDSIGLYCRPTEMQINLGIKWLLLIDMLHLKHKVFVDLTAGQQRLVLIVRAMIKHPPLLILDEPTTGLDDADTALFVALVNKIAVETNTAIIYVSHRKEEGLKPTCIYELVAGENGSIGFARKNH